MADQLLQQAGYPPHLGTPTDQHQTHPIGQDHNPAVLDQDQDPAVLDQDPTDLANQQDPTELTMAIHTPGLETHQGLQSLL